MTVQKIEISYKTIVFTVLFLLFIYFLYLIRELILMLFISFIIMAALNPLVNKIENKKIPRPLAIFIIYIVIFGLLAGLIALIVPVVISQGSMLLTSIPKIFQSLSFMHISINPNDYSSQLAQLPANIFKIISVTFSGVLKFFTFAVVTFYMLMERKNLDKHIKNIFKNGAENQAHDFMNRMEYKIGGWVRGEAILMTIIGVLSYIGLRLLDLNYAVPLAVFAGFLELIPNIGPTVSMIPAVIIGWGVSPVMGLSVVALYFLIQQFENNLIVPKVMQKSVGLHPLVSIFVLMIGLTLKGTIGMLLAIPIYLTLETIIKEIYSYQKQSSKKA